MKIQMVIKPVIKCCKASNLNDLIHQVFGAGNHHGHCASTREVHIFEWLIEFLNKNKDSISPENKIRIFVRYDACPSCQTMMYNIKNKQIIVVKDLLAYEAQPAGSEPIKC